MTSIPIVTDLALVNVVVTVIVMLTIYHAYIIPNIVKQVKAEFGTWLGTTKDELILKTKEIVDDALWSIKSSSAGKQSQAVRTAQKLLAGRDVVLENLDPETIQKAIDFLANKGESKEVKDAKARLFEWV